MNLALDHWKTQLITLSPSERVELAHFLLTSLEPEEEGVDEAWDAEASKRVEEIRSGGAAGRPVTELIADLRERYPFAAIAVQADDRLGALGKRDVLGRA